mmetsp:Transcript_21794/g.67670  ORF Transcript_21794/g.67670 Transcript_21794/m.67670 type:complete len:236 (-) Transcript_21794:604-1311(-)
MRSSRNRSIDSASSAYGILSSGIFPLPPKKSASCFTASLTASMLPSPKVCSMNTSPTLVTRSFVNWSACSSMSSSSASARRASSCFVFSRCAATCDLAPALSPVPATPLAARATLPAADVARLRTRSTKSLVMRMPGGSTSHKTRLASSSSSGANSSSSSFGSATKKAGLPSASRRSKRRESGNRNLTTAGTKLDSCRMRRNATPSTPHNFASASTLHMRRRCAPKANMSEMQTH